MIFSYPGGICHVSLMMWYSRMSASVTNVKNVPLSKVMSTSVFSTSSKDLQNFEALIHYNRSKSVALNMLKIVLYEMEPESNPLLLNHICLWKKRSCIIYQVTCVGKYFIILCQVMHLCHFLTLMLGYVHFLIQGCIWYKVLESWGKSL